MNIQALRDDVHYFFARVQTGHGILEDHLHISAQVSGGLRAHLSGNILTVKNDLTSGGIVQPDHCPSNGGFARAGLAYESIRLARKNVKGHIVHGFYREFPADGKILLEMLHFQERSLLACSSFRHCASPLPVSFSQSAHAIPAAYPP